MVGQSQEIYSLLGALLCVFAIEVASHSLIRHLSLRRLHTKNKEHKKAFQLSGQGSNAAK